MLTLDGKVRHPPSPFRRNPAPPLGEDVPDDEFDQELDTYLNDDGDGEVEEKNQDLVQQEQTDSSSVHSEEPIHCILIVEEDFAWKNQLETIFHSFPYKVRSVSNAEASLGLLRHENAAPELFDNGIEVDVVMTANGMSNTNGLQLLQELHTSAQERLRTMPRVIMLTEDEHSFLLIQQSFGSDAGIFGLNRAKRAFLGIIAEKRVGTDIFDKFSFQTPDHSFQAIQAQF